MGLITGILGLPTAPLRGTVRIAEVVRQQAEEAYYDPATFDALYNGANLATVKKRYDPEGRLPTLYEKAVGRR